jgi:hypothetical protein
MKTYGNDVFSYSPFGRQYVTRWNGQNPLASALSSTSPLSSGTSDSPLGSTRSSGGSNASGASDNTQSEMAPNAGAPRAGASLGSPFGGVSHGRMGSGIGTALGLGMGLGGAGLVGNAIGTGIDVSRANAALDASRQNNPGMFTGPNLGVGSFLSGMVNNATGGLFGTSIGDAGIGAAISDVSMPGVPGNPAADPDSFTSAQAGGGSFGGGGEPGSSVGGSVGGGSGEVSGEGAPGGYAKGGHVTRDRLHGPNPPGPDDGYAALDEREFVIRQASADKLGPDILARLNSGKFDRAKLAKALLGR